MQSSLLSRFKWELGIGIEALQGKSASLQFDGDSLGFSRVTVGS